MSNNSQEIERKIWNCCNILRDGGVSFTNYIYQITSLLFLKMRDEQTKPPYNEPYIIPKQYRWDTLLEKKGSDLKAHYERILSNLSKEDGLLGLIYKDATNNINHPADLEKLIHAIDGEEWVGLDLDIKGDIYEGLLEKHSDEAKGNAGQYFTPRALIAAIIQILKPKPGETICDPACGTGGFFLAAKKYIVEKYRPLDIKQLKQLKSKTFYGTDITPDVVRLCAMNMYLHGLATSEAQIRVINAFSQPVPQPFDIVMTNPPFGSAASQSSSKNGRTVRDSDATSRGDFWATTKDKELNFLQHVYTSLKIGGRCGIVVPDGVLFGSTNAHQTIREKMMDMCDIHTILRLPTGIFYANGVKANVLFFTKKGQRVDGKSWTKKTWFYDLRTNMRFTQKEKKMERHHLDDFVKCCMAKKRVASERFKMYNYGELHDSWDKTWMKDDSVPDVIDLPDMKNILKDITSNVNGINKSMKKLTREIMSVK